jgi:hypothetical protein
MMHKLIFILLVFCGSTLTAVAQPLDQWAHNHPDASLALGNWVKQHPAAAHKLFEWDAKHPERSQELVNWAMSHPRENLQLFLGEHRNWPEMEAFTTHHAAAMEEFLVWCRNHAAAAKALMTHSGALAWAGDHLYREYMNMETPGKR